MWWSIILSALIVTGTMAWQLGKQWKIAGYLKKYGVSVCQDLHRPYGPNGPIKDADIAKTQCEDIVTHKHELCLKQTQPLRKNLRQRRRAYVTCIITEAQTTALNQHQSSKSTENQAPNKP